MMLPLRSLVSAFAAVVLLTSCAQYASVDEKRPTFPIHMTRTAEELSVSERIANARKLERRDPLSAIGKYLEAARRSADVLAGDPTNEVARQTYNYALARVFSTIRDAKLDPWTKPLIVPSGQGEMTLTYRPDSRKAWNPSFYTFTPADQFDVKGKYVSKHTKKDGIGAPLVAVGKELNTGIEENFFIPRAYYGVTAVARFEKQRCTLSFEDPLATETTKLSGRVFPLAADFTVPLAVMLASTNPKKLELSRMLHPQKYAETARIARLQPYDPNKTVVLVIHGLMDTPATWAPMLNALRGDERIRKNYQFWFYSYPSGYPYPQSAAILRRQLDAIEKKFPLRKPMVVIGHSMGGCISRVLMTDSRDKIWMDLLGEPPEKMRLSAESKALLADMLIFRHRPEIGRVIFISAPLRGSDLAVNPLGRFGAELIQTPITLLKAGNEVLKYIKTEGDSLKLKRMPNSVDTLAPNNRFVVAINKLPLAPGIPYHTIMGDRGKGGNENRTKPVRSDGVVPYWSSHMEGAVSELVVPSNHSAHQNAQAIAEVDRILRTYAAE